MASRWPTARRFADWLQELAERLGIRAAARRPGWRQRLGRRGERMAGRYLRRRGYRIVARNVRAAGAEIDLVAMDGETLVFVEVKMRRHLGAGAPEEAVDARKQQHLRRAAAAFAARMRADARPMRFDIVAISAAAGKPRIELFKDAF
jgi:putative endonuclease